MFLGVWLPLGLKFCHFYSFVHHFSFCHCPNLGSNEFLDTLQQSTADPKTFHHRCLCSLLHCFSLFYISPQIKIFFEILVYDMVYSQQYWVYEMNYGWHFNNIGFSGFQHKDFLGLVLEYFSTNQIKTCVFLAKLMSTNFTDALFW